MAKKMFKKEFMLDTLYGDSDVSEVVEDTISDTTRWSVLHDLIFKFDDKYWSTYYSVGATEQQYESAWEYEEEVEACEVEKKEVVAHEWVAV